MCSKMSSMRFVFIELDLFFFRIGCVHNIANEITLGYTYAFRQLLYADVLRAMIHDTTCDDCLAAVRQFERLLLDSRFAFICDKSELVESQTCLE